MEDNLITASKVASKLNVSVPTLTNWYGWYDDPNTIKPTGTPVLPPYIQLKPRGTRFWRVEDIAQIRKFKRWIPKGRAGIMGDRNAKFWGDRGKRAIENKKQSPL